MEELGLGSPVQTPAQSKASSALGPVCSGCDPAVDQYPQGALLQCQPSASVVAENYLQLAEHHKVLVGIFLLLVYVSPNDSLPYML